MPNEDRPVFVLRLRPLPGVDAIKAAQEVEPQLRVEVHFDQTTTRR
jgi:hypothetical protein